MGLDIRLPIGLLLSLIGLVLTAFGAVSDEAIYQRSLGINVNLWWGLTLLCIGIIFIALSRSGRSAMHSSDESEEGMAIELREHAAGLEKENGKR